MCILNLFFFHALIFKNPLQNAAFIWLYIPMFTIVVFPIVRHYLRQWYANNKVTLEINPENHQNEGRIYNIMISNHSSKIMKNSYAHVRIDSKEFSYSRKYYNNLSLLYDSENFPHLGKLKWTNSEIAETKYLDLMPGQIYSAQFIRYNYIENILEVESDLVVRKNSMNENIKVLLNPDYNLNFRIYLNTENFNQVFIDLHWNGKEKSLYNGPYKPHKIKPINHATL
ncbi:MAG: hypothetical protein Q8K70_12105 [Bacteroidota bacterium]|nr:hypothetical protein [Bacteroidota bacterium]